jgi:hypothetical protein
MLIRIENDELIEFPDDLVAMMLAAPVVGDQADDPDLSIEELNCLIHGMLGSLSGEGNTHEQDLDSIRDYCALMGNPTAAKLEKARAQVKFYNEKLTPSEIGRSDRETIRAVFGFQSNTSKTDDGNTIDYAPTNIKSLPSA